MKNTKKRKNVGSLKSHLEPRVSGQNSEQSRCSIEAIIDLVCKEKPEIMKPYKSLTGFENWFRGLNATKLYKKRPLKDK